MSQQFSLGSESHFDSYYNFNPPKHLVTLVTPIYKSMGNLISDYRKDNPIRLSQ